MSAEAGLKQPGHEGCGVPSDVSEKFFVLDGVLDSKLIV
jgi:hypothetical protein